MDSSGAAGAAAAAAHDSGESDDASNYQYQAYKENSQIIYQGFLWKLANYKIKGWKLRYFELDATKHQIRYFDTKDDYKCKGTIELCDVLGVDECASIPGAPKKADETCFFELRT